MKILLVDDHAIVREGFSTLLSSVLEGAGVTNAKNAQQATNALRANHFDLIILDINLGATSGLTLAEYIVQRWEHAKVLMFSMFDDISIIDRAMKLGAMGYVSKQSEPLITRDITYSIQDSVIVTDEDNKICRQIINGY